MTVARLGFAVNPTKPEALELLEQATTWCASAGIERWWAPAADTAALIAELPGSDALVVLGGDGTFLRAAAGVAEVDVPILGINLGKVGFLSKAEGHDLVEIMGDLAEGRCALEERMLLQASILPGGESDGSGPVVALNDVVVARGSLARVCHLDVTIDESHLAAFIADGLVVASPTGSTGYSFSAGGPILDPRSRNLIVTPIAAYLSAIRAVVVSPDQVVRCRVDAAHESLASIDGWQDRRLTVGDVVEVRALDRPIRLLEPRGARPFWELLREKVELLPS
jgi:NAD+ kinase